MFDLISDIFSALSKNKLRTFLTGFSMAWGVLMLMILLGCGNGLKNAMMSNYSDQSRNVLMMWPGRTTKPFKGLKAGRQIRIKEDDLKRICEGIPQITDVSPVRHVWGVTTTYGSEYITDGGLMGITMAYDKVNTMNIIQGRGINELDNLQMRKVIVMHQRNAKNLFKGKNPVGEYVIVGGVPYLVIGIYRDNDNDNAPMHMAPLSTVEKIYPSANGYNQISYCIEGITNKSQSQEFEDKLKAHMAEVLGYDPKDPSAVWIWNVASSYFETLGIMKGLSAFLWLIGLGTLIAGIVGISNIMLVTVKERTKEFGIRKALGARPRNIISLILTESLMITAIFGYAGMLLGIAILEGLSKIFPSPDPAAEEFKPSVFANPSVDLNVAVGAMVILIAAGLVAAYVPARKAVDVKPIEALHYE